MICTLIKKSWISRLGTFVVPTTLLIKIQRFAGRSTVSFVSDQNPYGGFFVLDLRLPSLAKCLLTMATHSWFSSSMFMCGWQQTKWKSLYWYIVIISRKWILYSWVNKMFWKMTQLHYNVCMYMYLVCNSDSHHTLFIHTDTTLINTVWTWVTGDYSIIQHLNSELSHHPRVRVACYVHIRSQHHHHVTLLHDRSLRPPTHTIPAEMQALWRINNHAYIGRYAAFSCTIT